MSAGGHDATGSMRCNRGPDRAARSSYRRWRQNDAGLFAIGDNRKTVPNRKFADQVDACACLSNGSFVFFDRIDLQTSTTKTRFTEGRASGDNSRA